MNKDYLEEYEFELANQKLIKSNFQDGIECGLKQGLEQGKKQGLEQGLEQEKINTAKRMLEEKMDIELISKITNLTVAEISKLKTDF